MRLSTRVRYAMRARIVLTRSPDPCTSQRIAQEERLSKKYMDEILGTLRQGGILQTRRGVSGGYRIQQPMDQISLWEIIELLDGPVRLAPCVEEGATCPRGEMCLMNTVWDKLNSSIRTSFAEISLADIAANGHSSNEPVALPVGICTRTK